VEVGPGGVTPPFEVVGVGGVPPPPPCSPPPVRLSYSNGMSNGFGVRKEKHTMRGVALTAIAVARATRIENFMLKTVLMEVWRLSGGCVGCVGCYRKKMRLMM